MDIEVREIEPGRLRVEVDGGGDGGSSHVVLIPAGVGVPGASDAALASTVVEVLRDRGQPIPTTLDVTSLLRAEPGLWRQVETRLDE